MIRIAKARVHNLKDLSLSIPRNTLTVITGVSGSGKSSLAFDTIHAEGQRRFMESLSSYARQFLQQMEKPDVESIEGLSPTIAIQQKTTSRNPRSTVGTVTELYDYFRLLYAAIGEPHCPQCGAKVTSTTPTQIVDALLGRPAGTRLTLLAPVVRGRKGEYQKVFEELRREGFSRVRIDGKLQLLEDELPKIDPKKSHTIEVAIDRISLSGGREEASRLNDAVELSFKMADGQLIVVLETPGGNEAQEVPFSEKLRCGRCEVSLPEINPRLFSFNAPYGACPQCSGLGFQLVIDPDLIFPDRSLALADGGISSMNSGQETILGQWLVSLSRHYGFSLQTPIEKLPKKVVDILLEGSGTEEIEVFYEGRRMSATFKRPFEGIIHMIDRRYKESASDEMRTWYEKFMRELPCPSCAGKRLSPAALAVTVEDLSIHGLAQLSVGHLVSFFDRLHLDERQAFICKKVLEQIRSRIRFLNNVGLDYLTLARAAHTLSGGEAQRIRLATQIGSALVGITYVLDEPSIGLHPRDNRRLIDTLKNLRDLGNTVLVVEHDHEIMLEADHLIDLGPGAGSDGGRLVAKGVPAAVAANAESLTGRYLAGIEVIDVPARRRQGSGDTLTLRGARHNNLKDIDVAFPLGKLIAITGVSGSGKSSLVADTLFPLLSNRLMKSRLDIGGHAGIDGLEYINKVVNIDQDPIGRSPRSNPSTYTGLFSPIRTLFSQTLEARSRGYTPGRFSFNVKGGRCEVCEGTGQIQIEMHFLPDVFVTCDACKGLRFNDETLKVHFKGKNIAEVLAMTVTDALAFFEAHYVLRRKLETLRDVGLGYITLGQASTTLSGGEAQRIKLATELSRMATGQTFYILDEPTTGLHFQDVRCLLGVLERLVEKGNTVVVVEHNLDVIKVADWVIDLGPEGGDAGGRIIAAGTPEQVAKNPDSMTGRFLADALKGTSVPAGKPKPTAPRKSSRARSR
ncbi:MAG TPA: excinuclease ABC subunit UvrA [Candidatus Ozemobacteraceae bacterium]|nr:excinuclease ABC subunit UvrA [Candidatus Ozemobacteraceae bacterium]